jgi:4-amino-4-deoxy-L-arabinose transferase-like glycosyltransferase
VKADRKFADWRKETLAIIVSYRLVETTVVKHGVPVEERPGAELSTRVAWLIFFAIFAAVQFGSLFNPPLLDDVDAAHAQAAQHFAESTDWVTAKINDIRYIEKPPLPYWLVAISYKVFGQSSFSTHLPNSLAMLGLTWLAWLWAGKIWGARAGFYAGLGVLTSLGAFLFTRFIIPEAILSLFLLVALYAFIRALESDKPARFYLSWAAVALAVLIKGFIAPAFFIGALIPYLLISGEWRKWRSMRLASGFLVFLAVAAPWHILVGIANPDQGHPVGNHPTVGNVHGFFYFYFVNEHFLRFFGQRYPHDYNKLPFIAYWLLHFVWLFPWSLFLPAVIALAWKNRHGWLAAVRDDSQSRFRERSILLLGSFVFFTLLFFSISTNQEYYTFPVWPPLFILIAGGLANIEKRTVVNKWLSRGHGVFAVLGTLIAIALAWCLWESRDIPFVSDIGTLLAHRAVAGYTLSMSHFFDLTGPSFAALRLPAIVAAITLLIGPALGWRLRLRGRNIAATLSVAATSAVFLVAAHIALARFDPMLSSKQMADTIIQKGSPADSFIVMGEQSDASSVIFYTHSFLRKPTLLVYPRCGQHGEGSTLLWGSCYPDAPDIFLSPDRLSQRWGTGNRNWLFAQDTARDTIEQLLGKRLFPVQVLADKTLWTDRPL